jgi:hypothetical protein
MARKRRKTTTPTRRRRSYRRMGAVPAGLEAPISMIGGAVLGRFLVNKFIPTQNDTIKGAVQLGLGYLANSYAKNGMISNAGSGMIVAGGLSIVKSVAPAVIGAEDDVLVISGQDMIGADDISEINGIDQIGADDISEVNGFGEYDY